MIITSQQTFPAKLSICPTKSYLVRQIYHTYHTSSTEKSLSLLKIINDCTLLSRAICSYNNKLLIVILNCHRKGCESADLVYASEANLRSPQTVIKFYESKLTWHDSTGNVYHHCSYYVVRVLYRNMIHTWLCSGHYCYCCCQYF